MQVEKKLQMRMEAQGKYLQAIYSRKPRATFSYDATRAADLEAKATRSRLTDFNLALSGFMDNVTQACEQNNGELVKAMSKDSLRESNLGFQLCHGVQADLDGDDARCAMDEGRLLLLLLDLNIRGRYDHHGPGFGGPEDELAHEKFFRMLVYGDGQRIASVKFGGRL